jgi:cellulose synthase/poly-beta-1,6-N-acetylglucosamine synthase-like glycosyltransferase
LIYIYFGFPLLVYSLASLLKKYPNKQTFEPTISILISAFNEEESIEDTLLNKFNLDYPPTKREIIVVSDGSTDKTDEIVNKYTSDGIKFIKKSKRGGKSEALNLAASKSQGEILVFSDANSIYDKKALKVLMQNFNDPEVGYVTGQMKYVNLDGSLIGDGCSSYMKYENFIREKESLIGSIVGVDGGIDAMRKNLYMPMRPDQLPDFILPLAVISQGYRVIYESSAILFEQTLTTSADEYQMRVRVSLRALWALWDMRSLWNLTNFNLYSFQLWSHKILRYLAFIFLILLYIVNLLLFPQHIFYKISFYLQNIFYLSAAFAFLFESLGIKLRIFYPIQYFVLINMAAAHAFFKFLLGKKQITWNPRKGK